MTLYGSFHNSSHVVIICLLLRVGTVLLQRAVVSVNVILDTKPTSSFTKVHPIKILGHESVPPLLN